MELTYNQFEVLTIILPYFKGFLLENLYIYIYMGHSVKYRTPMGPIVVRSFSFLVHVFVTTRGDYISIFRSPTLLLTNINK